MTAEKRVVATKKVTGEDGRLLYVCEADSSEGWADFKCWDVTWWTMDGEAHFGDVGCFSEKEFASYRDAEPLLIGYVKWDGCSEWKIDSHHCGVESVLARHRRELDCLRVAREAMVSAGGSPDWEAP